MYYFFIYSVTTAPHSLAIKFKVHNFIKPRALSELSNTYWTHIIEQSRCYDWLQSLHDVVLAEMRGSA